MRRYRRFSRRRRGRIASRRVAKSLSRTIAYRVPCRALRPAIIPGDCWIKRRVMRELIPEASKATNFTFGTLWQALVCGLNGATAQQPFQSSTTVLVKIKSMYFEAGIPGEDFQVTLNENIIMSNVDTPNPREYAAACPTSIQYAKLGIKIPVQQRKEISLNSGNASIIGTINQPAGTSTFPFRIVFSVLMRV